MRAWSVVLSLVLVPWLSCGSNNSGTDGSTNGGDAAAVCLPAGTLNVSASDNTAYVIDSASNPTLTLCRGSTYTFALDAPGHPFYIKTVQGAGSDNAYDTGVTGNGTDVGNLIFAVPADAPATLFYDCSIHPPMTGLLRIVD